MKGLFQFWSVFFAVAVVWETIARSKIDSDDDAPTRLSWSLRIGFVIAASVAVVLT